MTTRIQRINIKSKDLGITNSESNHENLDNYLKSTWRVTSEQLSAIEEKATEEEKDILMGNVSNIAEARLYLNTLNRLTKE